MNVEELRVTLKTKLLHGDSAHQEWLCSAIDAVFDGEEPPKPYGLGSKEALKLQLKTAVSLLQKVIDECLMDYYITIKTHSKIRSFIEGIPVKGEENESEI